MYTYATLLHFVAMFATAQARASVMRAYEQIKHA